jgi:hypothetical protein
MSYLGRNGLNNHAFDGLVNLEVLDLSMNLLNTVPPQAKLPSLKVRKVEDLLDLSMNLFSYKRLSV